MIGNLFDIIIVAATDKKVVVLIHQCLRAGKCWKPLRASLTIFLLALMSVDRHCEGYKFLTS